MLLYCNINLFGQSEKHYNIKNGLPSNNVYAIKQDKRGYIWATTDKGVVRYDGKTFKLYTIDQGLASNDNFAMLIDSKDNVWLYSFKAISKINNQGKCETFGNTKSYFSQFLINKDDEIFFSTQDTLNPITNLGSYSHYMISKNILQKIPMSHSIQVSGYAVLINDKYTILFYNNQLEKLFAYQFNSENIKVVTVKEIFNDILFSDTFWGLPDVLKIDDAYFSFFEKFYVRTQDNFSERQYFPKRMIKVGSGNVFSYNELHFFIFNYGIYAFNVKNNSWSPFLSISKPTSILIDQEKNVWVSTMGDGIIKYSNLDLKSGQENIVKLYDEPIKKVNGFKNQTLWIANSKNEVKELFKNKERYAPDLIDLRFLETNDDGVIYFGGSNAVYHNGKVFSQFGFKAFDLFKDSIAISSTFGSNFLHKRKLTSFKLPDNRQRVDIKGRMYAILLLDGKFYSGNQKGLYWGRPSVNQLHPICLDDEHQSVSVNGIKKSSDGSIWVSTDGNGVYVLKDDVVVYHFLKELLDLNIHSMKVDEKDRVWLATRKGVNMIKKDGENYKINNYTSFHGLPDDYINDTYCYDDLLYIATDEGLSRVNLKELEKINFYLPPPVYVNSIKIINNDWKMLNLDSIPFLDFDQNSLNFEYTGISYKSQGKLHFEYRLLPIFTDWRSTDNDNITFNNLKPDTYTFEVRAIDAIGTISNEPAAATFTIKKHFSQEWWFLTLVLFFGLGLLATILGSIQKYKRKKMEEKTKIDRLISELRLQSLQAQLNPHFVFNSLNAIQQFINAENKKAANDYLSKFARLMRLYLNGSDSQLITLAQEIEVLKLYVSLEHLRFADKFEYSIMIDDDLALDTYKVPAMLLQPHVENAIRHGLIPADKSDNKLQIIVKSQDNGILCIIEDNGIGRAKSFELKQKRFSDHKSMGTKITKERLDMIRALKLGNISEQITDLTDGNNCPIGTRVEILIT